jgi:hypothetical protein
MYIYIYIYIFELFIPQSIWGSTIGFNNQMNTGAEGEQSLQLHSCSPAWPLDGWGDLNQYRK